MNTRHSWELCSTLLRSLGSIQLAVPSRQSTVKSIQQAINVLHGVAKSAVHYFKGLYMKGNYVGTL